MDTRTGEIVSLNEIEAALAKMEYEAYLAGLTKDVPRYVPIKKDRVPFHLLTAKQRKRRGIRSHKDWNS